MKKLTLAIFSAGATFAALAGLYGDIPDAKHAWAVHDWNRPKPERVTPAAKCGGAPSDAIVLFDGTHESLDANWCNEKGEKTQWHFSDDGFFYCDPSWKNGGSIRTRREFGDCQLHIEYRHDPKRIYSDKGPQMRGNSGVFLMGTATGYEIQVLESYYTCRELAGKPGFVDNYADGQAGSVYAENPPMVNPARKPGEWQVYDIVFHQPVWKDGKLVHPGSVTVLFNGVLVQDAWEMEGLTTHCRRRPLAPHPTKGPLALQDHGCVVQFRNVWIREIPSRWANLTHSAMSADPEAVMAERRATAAALYAKIKDRDAVTPANASALAEVISYANEGAYAAQWKKVSAALAEALAKKSDAELKAMKGELEGLSRALGVLKRGGAIGDGDALAAHLAETMKRIGGK